MMTRDGGVERFISRSVCPVYGHRQGTSCPLGLHVRPAKTRISLYSEMF